jgi:hypothetical protein
MVCFCAAGGCLIVAWLRDLEGASIGAAGPCRTSCPSCRGSYREGFSHWCRSRSLNPDIATGARPSRNTRPGLRSRPLGRRTGCSSAEPYAPPRPLLIQAVVLPHNLWHHANHHSSAVSGSSRVALGIAPQGSHRAGLAQFRHPARHVAASLSLTRSGRLTVTRSEVQCPRRGSGFQSATRHPLRSTGSGRAHSPASSLL